MGRPLAEIDQTQFEKLCALQCTKGEICGWFDVTDKTIEAWCKRTYQEGFSDVFSKKREAGKISLRRAQWRLAEKSAAMAIFLGKQYLGQSEMGGEMAIDSKLPEDPLSKSLREEAERMDADVEQ